MPIVYIIYILWKPVGAMVKKNSNSRNIIIWRPPLNRPPRASVIFYHVTCCHVMLLTAVVFVAEVSAVVDAIAPVASRQTVVVAAHELVLLARWHEHRNTVSIASQSPVTWTSG